MLSFYMKKKKKSSAYHIENVYLVKDSLNFMIYESGVHGCQRSLDVSTWTREQSACVCNFVLVAERGSKIEIEKKKEKKNAIATMNDC